MVVLAVRTGSGVDAITRVGDTNVDDVLSRNGVEGARGVLSLHSAVVCVRELG